MITFSVDSPNYNVIARDVVAWSRRALPDEGRYIFRVDLVDEGALLVHAYVANDDGKIRYPMETYTEILTGVEMPDLSWFREG